MSRPEIALHNQSNKIEERSKGLYIKRTQRDYSLSFKLQLVREIESGEIGINAAMRKYGIQGNGTIPAWRRKFGTFDELNKSRIGMDKIPQQKIYELEQQVKL